MADYAQIPVTHIQASPYQARKAFDDEALQGLAASMKQEGLIEPIVVRRGSGLGARGSPTNPESRTTNPTVYELISGERRLRAARLLGWETIEAKIITTVSEGEAAAKGLVENLQREDLNPMEEAEGFATLQKIDSKYWNQEKIAEVCGKKQSYVSDSMRILDLPEEIVENIRRRIFSRSHGIELSRLPTTEQQLAVAEKIPGQLTREETRDLVNSILKAKKGIKKKKVNIEDPLGSLWPSLQANSAIEPMGSWDVRYKTHWGPMAPGMLGWHFWVLGAEAGGKTILARWFRRMAEALESSPKGPTASDGLSAEERRRFELDSAEGRLPKTPEEEAELFALIPQGPGAVFAWLYGAQSALAQNVRNSRWEDLAASDPVQSVKEMLDDIRYQR